jgi:hypothetical protein
MLHEEFYKLTGIAIQEETYNTFVDPMYMATDMDKEPFCKDFKKHDLLNSRVALELLDKIAELQKKVYKLEKEKEETVDRLIKMDDYQAEQIAIRLIGHEEVIYKKLADDYDLRDEDKCLIMRMIEMNR